MAMIDQLFLKHPREVAESYPQHMGVAMRFGFLMVRSGLACMIHGIVPALFTRTGSSMVKRLYGEMRARFWFTVSTSLRVSSSASFCPLVTRSFTST